MRNCLWGVWVSGWVALWWSGGGFGLGGSYDLFLVLRRVAVYMDEVDF